MGRRLGDPDGPAAGLGPLGREVLDARHDGHRPQHRPQRRVRARAWPRHSGDERFALDSYRRLLQMFGATVLGIDGEHFAAALDDAKHAKGTTADLDLDVEDLRGAGRRPTRRSSASTPAASSRRTRASSSTWPSTPSSTPGTPSARCSTAARSGSPTTSAPPSTSRSWCSATGARAPAPASASPATPPPACRGVYGDYLAERPGRGRRRRHPQHDAARRPRARSTSRRYDELLAHHGTLETHYRDLCDIEFTIERGKLWMLQTRVGKRTPEAAFRIAVPAWSTRGSSTSTRRCAGSPAPSWPS